VNKSVVKGASVLEKVVNGIMLVEKVGVVKVEKEGIFVDDEVTDVTVEDS